MRSRNFDVLFRLFNEHSCIDCIASSSVMDHRISQILGNPRWHNTNVEGYPGDAGSFYANRKAADPVQQHTIDTVCEAFGCEYANVQSYSASNANTAVIFGLYREVAKPHGRKLRVMAADTARGGHFTHGQDEHITGEFSEVTAIPQKPDSSLDLAAIEKEMSVAKPDVLLVGGSSNTKQYDFTALKKLCDKQHVLLWVDASHHAGYMLTGHYPSPFPAADIVTCSMHKSFPGPRTGLILARDKKRWETIMDNAVHPGVQGEPNMANIVATAEVIDLVRKDYAKVYKRTYENAQVMARTFKDKGFTLVGDGTETHIVMLDLSKQGIRGREAADFLRDIGVLTNQMPTPADRIAGIRSVDEMSGLRLGTFAMSQRGFNALTTAKLTAVIGEALSEYADLRKHHAPGSDDLKKPLEELTKKYSQLVRTIQNNRFGPQV